MLRLLLWGASGRMGQALVVEIERAADLQLAGGVGSLGSANLGRDLGELAGLPPLGHVLQAEPPAGDWEVLIDFSLPTSGLKGVAQAAALGKPAVVGVTGLTSSQTEELQRFSERIPVFYAANFSRGIAMFMEMIAPEVQALWGGAGREGQMTLDETHHESKKDSPSGTALALAHQVGLPASSITAHRSGQFVFEHGLTLHLSDEETLQIRHSASSRQCFAVGALQAARWLHGRAAGFYSMGDMPRDF